MSADTLAGLKDEIRQEQNNQDAKEGELIQEQQATEDEIKFKEAIEKAQVVMGGFMGGVNKLFDYVQWGENDKEAQDFYNLGVYRTADVLKKYDTPGAPGLLAEIWEAWKEEIKLGAFFAGAGWEIYNQVKAENARLEKEAADKEGKDNAQS
jgi:hypothetical protein